MPFDPSPRELTRDVEKGVILALLSEPAETPSQVEPARTRYDGFPHTTGTGTTLTHFWGAVGQGRGEVRIRQ